MSELFDQYKYEPKNKSVLAIIQEFEKEYSDIFEVAKTKWNHSIREFHRDATGLKLSRGLGQGKGMNISIRFLPDKDNEFIKLIDQHFPDLDFTEYTKIKALDQSLAEAGIYFDKNSRTDIYSPMKEFCTSYLKIYNLKELHAMLFSEMGHSKDVFGSYFFKDSRVELYYIPLIIFSQLHQVPLESLIVVVLAHELAHAYHHIGLDTDGFSWNSMDTTELEIVEGLAQYYTALFAEEQELIYPNIKSTYLKLQEFQSGPYCVHKAWLSHAKKEHVKHAFNVTRRNGIKTYQVFGQILKDAKNQLK